MSAHVLLNLLNKLGESGKTFNNTVTRMLDSIFHRTKILKIAFSTWKRPDFAILYATLKKKSGRRLDDNVKAYLEECLNKGEVTEQKASAKDVADTVKYKKDSDGKAVFSPDQ